VGVKKIVEGAWLIPLGFVNSVMLEGEDGELVLIDAGFPDHETPIFEAIESIGRRPEDLNHLVCTHAHPDHIGSAAAVVSRTGATTWMHPNDASVAESGGPFRPMTSSPGLAQKIGFRIFWRPHAPVKPLPIDKHMTDGDTANRRRTDRRSHARPFGWACLTLVAGRSTHDYRRRRLQRGRAQRPARVRRPSRRTTEPAPARIPGVRGGGVRPRARHLTRRI
jgi:Metallo-beta-lactamase superfamily